MIHRPAPTLALALILWVSGLAPAAAPAPDETIRTYVRLVEQARTHLTARRQREAEAAAFSALTIHQGTPVQAPLIDPAGALWVAAGGKKPADAPPDRCSFWPLAIALHQHLAVGAWAEATGTVQNLTALAESCGVETDDPRRSTLLIYDAYLHLLRGERARAGELRRQALDIRQRSLVDDPFESALFDIVRAAEVQGNAALELRRSAQKKLRIFGERHAVTRAVGGQP